MCFQHSNGGDVVEWRYFQDGILLAETRPHSVLDLWQHASAGGCPDTAPSILLLAENINFKTTQASLIADLDSIL